MLKSLMRLGLIEIIFLLLGILSIYVRLVFGDTTVIWRDLGAPPARAVRIVDGDYQSVRVQTESGISYFCRFNSPGQCWINNDKPSYFLYTYNSPYVSRTYKQPPALSGVVDTKKIYSFLSEYSQVLSIYAVTDKGKVYVWQDGFGTPFDVIGYVFEDIPVALLCGIVFWGLFELGWMGRNKKRRAVSKFGFK